MAEKVFFVEPSNDDIVQMIAERADLERTYANCIREWSKKWHDYLQKGNEKNSDKYKWMSTLNEADRLNNMHATRIQEWQTQNYPRPLRHIKTAEEHKDELKKVS